MVAKNKSTKSASTKANTSPRSERRSRLSQTDVPGSTLGQALRVARAIADQNGCQPARPMLVAKAMGMKPTTGVFRSLCGASIAYGFTEGGYNATQISLTDLGRRAVRPTEEGDDQAALREAVLRPRALGDFLKRYDGQKVPRKDIGHNVLVTDLGVPDDAAQRALETILVAAEEAHVLEDINGDKFVNLHGVDQDSEHGDLVNTGVQAEDTEKSPDTPGADQEQSLPTFAKPDKPDDLRARRVFITHGKNKGFVDNLKELLMYGKFEPVVSVERETASKPVPDKVLDDMRSCSAAIIHVDAERILKTHDDKDVVVLNDNVLIEIGAAMALYNRRFILLVEDQVALPSNLQGLYVVKYAGEELSYQAAMKLLKAFNDFGADPANTASSSASP